MKSQASPFSFGCLFHQMPFYHRTKTAFSLGGRQAAGSKQNSLQNHAPDKLSQRPKEDMDSSETSRYNLPPPSSLMCSVEAAWLNKTKTPMKQNSQKTTSASSFLCQCSGMAESQRISGPLCPHPGRLLLGLSTSHSQNHFLCKTSSLRRKNALIV